MAKCRSTLTGNEPHQRSIAFRDSGRREIPLGVQLELLKVFLVLGNLIGTMPD